MSSKIVKEEIKFTVPIILEDDNNEFIAYCPVLKGLHSCGKTEEETIENIKNAITAYLISLIKHKEPIPLCILKEKNIIKRRQLFKGHPLKHKFLEVVI